MTYQVSDTDVSTSEIRAVALRHCLMSYVFAPPSWPPRST